MSDQKDVLTLTTNQGYLRVPQLGGIRPSFVTTITIMSSSRSQEDTYEEQNDQRLDELHSKIRTLRGVCPLSGPHSYFSLTIESL